MRDGLSENSRLLGRYCNSAPMVVRGSTDTLWLRYYTVGTGSKGFEATWTTMKQTLKPLKPSEMHSTGTVPHPPSKFHSVIFTKAFLSCSGPNIPSCLMVHG